jgi:hypothetical protein
MNKTQDIVCPCTGEPTEANGTKIHWIEAESRFQRAKQALLDIQQQHCDAAYELLLARTQIGQMLEAVFPGAEAAPRPPVSTLNLDIRDDCNRAAA